MGLLSSIILILFRAVNRLRDQLTMCNSIATQLIGHDLPWLSAMLPEKAPEEPLGCSTIAFGLEKYINDFTVLINSLPKVMLLTVDLDKYFIDLEGVAVASMSALQSPGIFGPELDAPEPDCFIADGDAAFV